MSAYDPRQRREPAAPENSQQNGYFSAPTASGSAIPATPGQQPTAAFQAPYDGAREQPPTAFNASGQAPYNSVEPDPVVYQPTQAMNPVDVPLAEDTYDTPAPTQAMNPVDAYWPDASTSPASTQAMNPVDAFTPEPTQAMAPVIQPKGAGQDLPYATQAMPAATQAMPAATQAMAPIDAQEPAEPLPPSVSPRRGGAPRAGAMAAGGRTAGGRAGAGQRPPSLPPTSIPPGSIPPGGPLADDESDEDEEPKGRSKFMMWFILALVTFLAICFAIAWAATGNSIPDTSPSTPAVITPSLDSTPTPVPTSTTKPLSKSSPSPKQENNNSDNNNSDNNNNNQPQQPSQPEYTQPPQQNYPSAPSQPSYTSPSPYPNDPGNGDDDDDDDDDDGNNYIVPGPGDPNNSNS